MDKANRVTASAFITALIAAVPAVADAVLTDNGIQFRLPPRYADGPTAAERYLRRAAAPRERHRASLHQDQPSLDQRSTGNHFVEFSPVSLLAARNLSTLFVVHPKAIKACQQPWSEPALGCQLQAWKFVSRQRGSGLELIETSRSKAKLLAIQSLRWSSSGRNRLSRS